MWGNQNFVDQKWPKSIFIYVNFIVSHQEIWVRGGGGGSGGGWYKASVSDCLPLAAPIGLSPLHILTLCGPERVLVVSTEPPDDLSCLTTPGVGRPGDGLLPVPLTRCIQIGGGGGGLMSGHGAHARQHRVGGRWTSQATGSLTGGQKGFKVKG